MSEERRGGSREKTGAPGVIAARAADAQAVEDLRRALTLAGAVGAVGATVPQSRLLEMIVQTAAHVLSAQGGSLFLVDEEARELTFEVAIGPNAAEAKKFRVPLGHGIAGLVAATAQPLLISDAQNDPRLAADIARSAGYWPRSIFCIPLISRGKVIGVLELLDKQGAPSFGPADIEVLGLFGNLAAVAIEQCRAQRSLTALVAEALAALAGSPEAPAELPGSARGFVSRLEHDDPVYRRALDLGTMVQEIVEQGDDEFRTCETILRSFLQYLRSRAEPFQG
jgi:GAF domain-containing protein